VARTAAAAVLSPPARAGAGEEIVAGAARTPSTCHEPDEIRPAIGAARTVRPGDAAKLATGTIVVANAGCVASAGRVGAPDVGRRSPTRICGTH
jgi:hypothetical protein